MKYEKIFLSITFALAYFLSIILLLQGFVSALIIVMLVPAFAAMISLLIEFKSLKSLFKPFTYKITLKSVIFAIIFPLIIIFLCGALAIWTDRGVFSQDLNDILINVLKLILISIALFVGGLFEEYGWRGYLLPKLIKKYDIKKANMIMGIIVVLYHTPALLILNMHSGIAKAIAFVLLQSLAVYAMNYAFTYLYTLSQNVILPSIMHILWNNINVAVLGDSYRDVSYGYIIGNVKLINGECLFGVIFLSIFAIYAHRKFSRTVH